MVLNAIHCKLGAPKCRPGSPKPPSAGPVSTFCHFKLVNSIYNAPFSPSTQRFCMTVNDCGSC